MSASQAWIVAKYKSAGNLVDLYTSNVGFRKPIGKTGSIKFNQRAPSRVLVEEKNDFASQVFDSLSKNG